MGQTILFIESHSIKEEPRSIRDIMVVKVNLIMTNPTRLTKPNEEVKYEKVRSVNSVFVRLTCKVPELAELYAKCKKSKDQKV